MVVFLDFLFSLFVLMEADWCPKEESRLAVMPSNWTILGLFRVAMIGFLCLIVAVMGSEGWVGVVDA